MSACTRPRCAAAAPRAPLGLRGFLVRRLTRRLPPRAAQSGVEQVVLGLYVVRGDNMCVPPAAEQRSATTLRRAFCSRTLRRAQRRRGRAGRRPGRQFGPGRHHGSAAEAGVPLTRGLCQRLCFLECTRRSLILWRPGVLAMEACTMGLHPSPRPCVSARARRPACNSTRLPSSTGSLPAMKSPHPQ